MTEWNGEHVVPAPRATAAPAAPSEPQRQEVVHHQQQPHAPSMVAASHVAVHGSTRSSISTTSSSGNISRRQQLQAPVGNPVKARAPVSRSRSTALQGKAYFEFLPLQTSVKPTLRPKGLPASRNNQTTSDAQAAREASVAAARSQRFMAQAAALPAHPYHSTLRLGPEGAAAQEHVGQDRGKGRPEWCRSQTIFNPITSMSRPVTAPGRADARAGLLSPAKHSFAGAAAAGSDDVQASGGLLFCGNYGTATGQLTTLQRRPGSVCADRGRFNPITHTWLEPPSAEAQALQQKASERADGSISSRRRGSISTGSSSGAAGCLSNSRDSVGSLFNHGSRDAAGGALDGAPGRQAPARCGTNWGTYDPLRAVWVVPPSDARCASAEVGPGGIGIDRLAVTAEGMRPVLKASATRPQGEYNPITGQWVVEPTNWKAAQTLEFAPRQLFQDKAFVRR